MSFPRVSVREEDPFRAFHHTGVCGRAQSCGWLRVLLGVSAGEGWGAVPPRALPPAIPAPAGTCRLLLGFVEGGERPRRCRKLESHCSPLPRAFPFVATRLTARRKLPRGKLPGRCSEVSWKRAIKGGGGYNQGNTTGSRVALQFESTGLC